MTQAKENFFNSLEILCSIRGQSSKDTKIQNIFSPHIPELQIFKDLSNFSFKNFLFKWNLLITVSNLYNLFSSFYFLGLKKDPEGLWLEFEILFEGVFVVDMMLNFYFLRERKRGESHLLLEEISKREMGVVLMASIPFSTFYTLAQVVERESLRYLRLLKCLRVFQIHKFFTRISLVFKSKTTLLVVRGMILLFFSQHCSGMVYALVTDRRFDNDQEKYLEAFYWATETMTGIVLSSTFDDNSTVKIIAIILMTYGIVLYGIIFIRLYIHMIQLFSNRSEKSFWKRAVHTWTNHRKIPKKLQERIENFALIHFEPEIQDLFKKFPEEIPLSLSTEIGIFRFKSLVSKVKLFELSEPAFVLSVLRCFTEELFLSEDFIIRSGDQADSMYFIIKGLVEVIEKTGKNRIALMSEGEYFGEIGILMNVFRTVSVIAVEPCLLAKISKENMLKVLENYPDHRDFLFKIAKQRLKTCSSEDIQLDHDLVEDNCNSSDSDQEGELECPQYYSTSEHEQKSWVLKMLTVPESRSKKGSVLIDPLSVFFYFWVSLIGVAFTFCLIEIPFVIAFGMRTDLAYIDLVVCLVFIVDILVSYKSSHLNRYKKYVNNREEINKNYLDRNFILDVLSVVPIDWAYYSLQNENTAVYYFKTFRLLKIARVVSLFRVIQEHSKVSERMMKYLLHVYLYFVIVHVSACLLSYFSTSGNAQYVDCLYWSISIFSQSSYADINPNQSGIIVSIILSNMSKIVFVIFFIESVLFILEKNHFELEFLKRYKNIEEWMNHSLLTSSLKDSIKHYLLLKWDKLLGLEDEEVLKMFPDSLSTDLRLFLFQGITDSGLFPKDEHGALLALSRKCKIMIINEGLNVFTKGEIGLEMYFILEGTVEVLDSDLTVFKQIHQGGFFGELSIINEHPSLRSATVSAKTNLTLAVLNLMDFKDIVKTHQTFGRKVAVIAEERKKFKNFRDFEKFGENDSLDYTKNLSFSESHERTHVGTCVSSRDIETEVKHAPFVKRVRENKWNEMVYFAVWVWNVFFIPVQMGFNVEYNAALILMECLSMIFYVLVAIYYALEYQLKITSPKLSKNKNSKKVPDFLIIRIIYNILLSIPFSMIFKLSGTTDPLPLIILLCYLRISNILYIFSFFYNLKKKWISWYLSLEISKIFTVILAVSHISSCLFITISQKSGNTLKHSQKAGTDSSLYLTALYWSVNTLTHVTQGYVTSVSIQEKYFNIFYSFLCFFLFIIFFGEMVSLINVSKKVLKDQMFEDFNKTSDFLKKQRIEKLSWQIDSYFDFIWETHRGLQERHVISGLPFHLQSEIFIYRYSPILLSSDILNDDGILNKELIRSLCRFMKFHYFLLGDVILRIDDMHKKFYFILSGEVKIISSLVDSVICVLGPGNYFGETSAYYNTCYRTATVVATMFTHTFVVEDEHVNIIFQVFPEWKARIAFVAEKRVKSAFQNKEIQILSDNSEIVIDHQRKLEMNWKTEFLISQTVAEAKEGAFVEKSQNVEAFHFCLIVYSCFVLPIMVMFYENPPVWMIIMELIYIFESSIFICLEVKRLNSSNLNIFENIWKIIKSKFMIIDLISTFPCNLIIVLTQIDTSSVIIQVLRQNRLISILRIRSFLTSLSISYKSLNKLVTILEETLYLLLFIHWTACLFHLLNDCGSPDTYIDSLYFTLSIVSATGNSDVHPCHSRMMILVMITGTISTLALVVMMGILSLIFTEKKETPVEIYDSICENFSFFINKQVPKALKSRFKTFARFKSSVQHFYGEVRIKEIYKHLPENIVHKLIFEKSRCRLKKVPFLRDHYQEILFKRIALSLKAEIYLPGDYLIYKDDQGDEMYFIGIGVVNIISPDNSKIIKSLRNGDFVGEMALINNSPRICSVVANTLCLAFVLKKQDFDSILKSFPEVLETIRKYSEIRSRETTSIMKNPELKFVESRHPKQIISQLSMYSALASSFAVATQNQDKFSLITGMKNLKSCQDLDSFSVKDPGFNLFRRRPAKHETSKRRKSLEPLGKNLIFNKFLKI